MGIEYKLICKDCKTHAGDDFYIRNCIREDQAVEILKFIQYHALENFHNIQVMEDQYVWSAYPEGLKWCDKYKSTYIRRTYDAEINHFLRQSLQLLPKEEQLLILKHFPEEDYQQLLCRICKLLTKQQLLSIKSIDSDSFPTSERCTLFYWYANYLRNDYIVLSAKEALDAAKLLNEMARQIKENNNDPTN